VSVGETIVWVNKDPFPHTAAEIPSGKSWKYTAKEKGDYPYICTIHPSMKGTVHVK
jgi:plastocyanin